MVKQINWISEKQTTVSNEVLTVLIRSSCLLRIGAYLIGYRYNNQARHCLLRLWKSIVIPIFGLTESIVSSRGWLYNHEAYITEAFITAIIAV
ncbi:hypothetical protein [Terribacillus sp. AE2B 122]|uniref:hypothetical protein n=1 Tax=Terribacillus sp. AE2B 122 TaxID=1331902 RepID=UPI001583E4BD|nr:hypothetical protein [Terribacillus sp. AE2B 122]